VELRNRRPLRFRFRRQLLITATGLVGRDQIWSASRTPSSGDCAMATDTKADLFPWERDNELAPDSRVHPREHRRGVPQTVFAVDLVVHDDSPVPKPGWRDGWRPWARSTRTSQPPAARDAELFRWLSLPEPFDSGTFACGPGIHPGLLWMPPLATTPTSRPTAAQPGDESDVHTGGSARRWPEFLPRTRSRRQLTRRRRGRRIFVRSRPDLGSASDQDLVDYFRAGMAETRPTIATRSS